MECERGVFRAKRKRERVSARPIARHMEAAAKRHAERSLWAAKPHDGASDPVRTRIAFAATHVADNAAQQCQHGSPREPFTFAMKVAFH